MWCWDISVCQYSRAAASHRAVTHLSELSGAGRFGRRCAAGGTASLPGDGVGQLWSLCGSGATEKSRQTHHGLPVWAGRQRWQRKESFLKKNLWTVRRPLTSWWWRRGEVWWDFYINVYVCKKNWTNAQKYYFTLRYSWCFHLYDFYSLPCRRLISIIFRV